MGREQTDVPSKRVMQKKTETAGKAQRPGKLDSDVQNQYAVVPTQTFIGAVRFDMFTMNRLDEWSARIQTVKLAPPQGVRPQTPSQSHW